MTTILSYRCVDRDHHVTSPERLTECPVCGSELRKTSALNLNTSVRVEKPK